MGVPKKNNRYFIVFYFATYQGRDFLANIPVETEGTFLNYAAVRMLIEEKYGYNQSCITGFQEVTESDFKEWSMEL